MLIDTSRDVSFGCFWTPAPKIPGVPFDIPIYRHLYFTHLKKDLAQRLHDLALP